MMDMYDNLDYEDKSKLAQTLLLETASNGYMERCKEIAVPMGYHVSGVYKGPSNSILVQVNVTDTKFFRWSPQKSLWKLYDLLPREYSFENQDENNIYHVSIGTGSTTKSRFL